MKEQSWYSAKYQVGLQRTVPTMSGVYILAQVKRLRGLPITMEFLYVGKSKNLRRRWKEHVALLEPNPSLNGLANYHKNVEFWWICLSSNELDQVEKELIQLLRPKANRKGCGGNNESQIPTD